MKWLNLSGKFLMQPVVIFFIFSLSLASCKVSSDTLSGIQNSPSPDSAVQRSGSYITATTIQELTKKSPVIVIGHIVKTDAIINMARDVNDISKPDPNLLIVGQVYQIEVERYLKGKGGNILYVVQPEGILSIERGTSITQNEIEKARMQEKYIPMYPGNRYLMFLEPLLGFSYSKHYYTGVAQPWRFDLSDPEKVQPESPWSEASRFFQPQTLSDIIMQIERPEGGTSPPPYPPPRAYP